MGPKGELADVRRWPKHVVSSAMRWPEPGLPASRIWSKPRVAAAMRWPDTVLTAIMADMNRRIYEMSNFGSLGVDLWKDLWSVGKQICVFKP